LKKIEKKILGSFSGHILNHIPTFFLEIILLTKTFQMDFLRKNLKKKKILEKIIFSIFSAGNL